MAVIKSKGSVLSLTIASALTPIAQILSLDAGDVESETFEADYLDNGSPGIPYAPTGRVEGGKVNGELFFDQSLAGQAGYMALIAAPPSSGSAGTLSLGGSSSSTRSGLMSFVGAGFGMGLALALKDGVKGKFNIKVSGLPTFST